MSLRRRYSFSDAVGWQREFENGVVSGELSVVNKQTSLNHKSDMFKNYFKTAWRNIIRTIGYSLLNVSGLAIGMAVALLIGLWVYDQYSYDKFLPDYQQLYRVQRNFDSNGDTLTFHSTSLKLADALRNQIPEIEYVAESDWWVRTD